VPNLDLSRRDAAEEERVLEQESSLEAFDRLAFATRAVEIVRPKRMTVCVLEGKSKLSVSAGRAWGGHPEDAWAIVSIPKTASRRAIALAVCQLGARSGSEPYALDWLLSQTHLGPYRSP
jgi:hypothetical protein